MKELIDLEICKQITIFELNKQFPKAKSIEFDDMQNCFWVDSVGFTSWPLLDPLTDDGLCFRLMVKHKVNVHIHPEGGYHAVIRNDKGLTVAAVLKKSPNKAICLAIIELKKDL